MIPIVEELDTDIGGFESLYPQFAKFFGMRERVADVNNPKIHVVGDIELPMMSTFIYQGFEVGEVGPGNKAAFIHNYPKRINIYFNTEFTPVLNSKGIKILPTQFDKLKRKYIDSHFNYYWARTYEPYMNKKAELLVNNLAIAKLPIVYRQKSVFTGFFKSYNELSNIINSVEEMSAYDRHQFIEFKLPKVFPTYNELKLSVELYMKSFNKEGVIVKPNRQGLKYYQAEKSFWLMDLYCYLLGFQFSKYSQFSKLSQKAQDQLEIIFTYQGKAWVVNLGILARLIGWNDTPDMTEMPSTKINYFKRFYLNLISLVNKDIEGVVEEDERTESGEGDDGEGEGSRGDVSERGTAEEDPAVDAPASSGSLVDLYSSTKESDDGSTKSDNKRDKGEKGDSKVFETDSDIPVMPDGEFPEGELEDNIYETSTPDNEGWGSDISDDVFEQITVEKNAPVKTENVYTPESTLSRIIDEKVKAGLMTSKQVEFFKEMSESYKGIEIAEGNVGELVNIKPEDMELKNVNLCPESDILKDKEYTQSRTYFLTKNYITNVMERNIIEMAVASQNAGFCVTDINTENVLTADSHYKVYTIKGLTLDGKSSTLRFRIPVVNPDDFSFTINGVKSYMQIQRMEKPVRKVTPTKVQLTSYYDKKLMVERSNKVVDDYDRWLKNNIIEKSYKDSNLKISLGSVESMSDKTCYYYGVLSSRFTSITYDGLTLNFNTRELMDGTPKAFAKYCNDKTWLVGKENGFPIIIDSSGLITIKKPNTDQEDEVIGYLEDWLGLQTKKAPIPVVTININGYKFPAVVVLSYWIGFDNLIKATKVNYRTIDPDTRPVLTEDEFIVSFADERLVFNKKDRYTTMIFSGLLKLSNLSNFARYNLNDPGIWFSLINDPRVKPNHFNEMGRIMNMFIDPITARLLVKDKYPVVMDKLILNVIHLLMSNDVKAEVEITEQRFVGYEKFAGHLYRELSKSARQYANKPGNKKVFTMNPDAVMLNIITDSSTQACEEVSPINLLKQQEEVTYGGTFGREIQAMVKRTRGQMPNYEGIISEASKDSGKIGFISSLTSDAKIVDLYGNIDTSLKTTRPGRFSVTGNLYYGTSKESPQRSLFSSTQGSQIHACEGYDILPIRTNQDSVLGYRLGPYTSIAKASGKITEITKDGIVVTYDDGSVDKFPLGYDIGKGAGEYHRHNRVTDLKVGDKVTEGFTVAYDNTFLARDPLDPARLTWASNMLVRMALIEDQTTFEDSFGITANFAELSKSPYILATKFKVRSTDKLGVYCKVGDNVAFDQVLFDIQDIATEGFTQDDADVFEGMDRFGVKKIKSPQDGKVVKIQVQYNGDYSTWSDSLKKFVKNQDKERTDKAEYDKTISPTNNVGGNTQIGKIEIWPDTCVVTVWVEQMLPTTSPDKLSVGNQMKGTVGLIYPDPIYTADGREVHLVFSTTSPYKRMVLSIIDELVYTEYNNVKTLRMIEKYGTKI